MFAQRALTGIAMGNRGGGGKVATRVGCVYNMYFVY